MATLLMFAAIRQVSGTKRALVDGETLADVLANACAQFGPEFERLLPYCMVLVNDKSVSLRHPVSDDAEVAVLPPVSGGL